ncbi:MAG: tRNA (adenosine(37)-N6)-threonylcarbamoyltransferase complex dimerization subunit type 1 TsaB [Prolixibacteraceae bacterium]|nr:tRNA (adenosine(37)-N6)-threonylcarbamoyltransferase complex dimerization subunit type 1 TsaB [Prolixibacteraceae bacterium]
MAKILLLESSTEVCSVALAKDGQLVDLEENREGLNHSELLTSFVETIFIRNNISASRLDAVAVSKGPGSYTGLRIGVSAAKGLCYAAGLPLIAISTLESMAKYLINHPEEFQLKVDECTLFCPMIDARRMEVYYSVYSHKGEIKEPVTAKVVTEDTFRDMLNEYKLVLYGNGAQKCKDIIVDKNAVFSEPQKASARFMAEIAEVYFKKQKFEDVAYFEPFYLKDFIATIPKNKVL